MKKILSIITIGLLTTTNVFSQDVSIGKFYVGIHGGYNMKMAPTKDVDYLQIVTGLPFLTMDRNGDIMSSKGFSYGQGMNAGINIGYKFTDYFGVELGADYLMGSKTEFKEQEAGAIMKNSTKGKMIQLSPMVVVSTGNSPISGYVKAGLLVGLSGEISNDVDDRDGSDIELVHFVKNSGTALGFTGAGGVEFSISESMSFFSEIAFKGLTFTPKKGEITSYSQNGTDILPSFTVSDKSYVFENRIDMGASGPDSVPTALPTSTYNFNSVGLNIGLKFKF